jgi:nicotinate-nucleotide adenylyltransferase
MTQPAGAPGLRPVRRRRDSRRAPRIGIFGGTFDPPHVGHLAAAEWARDQLELDRVVFVPAGTPPHKRGRARSTVAARLAMTRLAVRGQAAFAVSDLETRRGGPSFTIDTLRTLAAREPHASLYLILGEDNLDEFHAWREPEAILALATLVVALRPQPATNVGGAVRRRTACVVRGMGRRGAVVTLDNPGIDLSSSAIRARARGGHSIRYLVPPAVERYICRTRLYR